MDKSAPMNDEVSVAAADLALCHWQGQESGQIRTGSQAHKRLFCRMLLDTHHPYKPAVIAWPPLTSETLARVTALSIWDIAVQTEGHATLRVQTYAQTAHDPLLREALFLDASEEARHKVVLNKLVEAYGITLAPEPKYVVPRDSEWGWLVTGYSECIDSFFAFGLFASAKQTGFFPAELVDTFEPVIQEEARHILFFANWTAWYRRQLNWWQRLRFEIRVARAWAFLIWERVGIAKGLDRQGQMRDANFALSSHAQVGLDLGLKALLKLCLAENERRMAGYDSRLLRPTLVPRLARFACFFLR